MLRFSWILVAFMLVACGKNSNFAYQGNYPNGPINYAPAPGSYPGSYPGNYNPYGTGGYRQALKPREKKK